jgi:transcription elongation factor GreA
VGAAEANPAEGSISNESPLGKALLGQKQSSKVRIKAPGGELIFRIVKVS